MLWVNRWVVTYFHIPTHLPPSLFAWKRELAKLAYGLLQNSAGHSEVGHFEFVEHLRQAPTGNLNSLRMSMAQ